MNTDSENYYGHDKEKYLATIMDSAENSLSMDMQ